MPDGMDGGRRERIIRILRARRSELAELGVVHAALFGSVARGDDRPDSYVDVMVDVDPRKVTTIFDVGEIQQALEEWLGRPVDLARRDRLRPNIAAEVVHDGVDAF